MFKVPEASVKFLHNIIQTGKSVSLVKGILILVQDNETLKIATVQSSKYLLYISACQNWTSETTSGAFTMLMFTR